MRRISMLAVLGLVAVAACVKEPVPAEPENQTITSSTFTATTEPATKTALSGNDTEGYSILWQDGDRIQIADNAGHAGQYATGSTGEKADFSFVSDTGTEAATGPYQAWYPASLYNGGTPTLPATQHYTTGNIAESPMYASSESKSLEFKNLCGIIRLNISTTQTGRSVRRIILSASNKAMSGPYTLAVNAAVVSGTAGVTLDCGNAGVEIGTVAKAFHIAVPQADYSDLKITVVTTGGEVQTRTSNKTISVSRSGITDITLPFNNLIDNNSQNLSANATANTYIVSTNAGYYRFNATIKGNGGPDPLAKDGIATTINPEDISGVTVLWEQGESAGEAIKQTSGNYDISYSATTGFVTFSKPSSTERTACVAIFRDGSGGSEGVYDKEKDEILWSWLLWVVASGPSEVQYSGKYFMDRNLGSAQISNKPNYQRGFLFQWGRKDAFSASADSNTNNNLYYFSPRAADVFTVYLDEVKSMAYTIAHPTARIVCLTATTHSWMPESEYSKRPWREDVKTIYDPCPPGWRVPTSEEMGGVTVSLPDTGYYSGESVSNNLRNLKRHETGYYWTSTIDGAKAYVFINDAQQTQWPQTEGCAIRPVRE